MKKILLTIAALVLMYSNSYSQTTIPGGIVSGTWTHAGSPYNIMGPIMIPDGSTLTIEPGAVVNFQGTYKMLVIGQLIAIGNPRDSITFTATNTTNGWRSIRFDNTPTTNDTSIISYCIIKYGKATGPSPDDCGGALYFRNFSKAIISNCRISDCEASDNGGGIFCENSNPPISNNTFSNNVASNVGGGIMCYIGSNPTILNNIITGNSSQGNGGGGISCVNSNPSIIKNILTYNNSDSHGGGIWCNGCSPNISNNIISNNIAPFGGAISCNGSDPTIINNTITNNTSENGGAIFSANLSNPTITNNTITNNNALKGGAIYFAMLSNPTIRNTIMWGNTASISGQQVYIDDEGSDPNFYYCDVQGGASAFEVNFTIYTGTYQNNIDSIPLFMAESAGSGTGYNGVTADWSLQSVSPCINAGDPVGTYPATDLAGYPRVFDSTIDIGAYEFQGYVGVNSIHKQDGLIIYPNPVIDNLVVENTQK